MGKCGRPLIARHFNDDITCQAWNPLMQLMNALCLAVYELRG